MQFMFDAYFSSYLHDLAATLNEIDRPTLARVVDLFRSARDEDRQIFIVGNGGSAATASHMACDLGKGTIDFSNPSFKRFRTISITDNNALITALGNDISFDRVFVEQLKNLLNPGDLVVIITASGNSPNLLPVIDYARQMGAVTIGLLGFGGGKARGLVDVPLVVSSRNYGIAEDFHLIVQHILTQYLQRALAGPPQPVVFLDRDGIVNESMGQSQYVTRWEEFRFAGDAVDTLRQMSLLGYRLVVVTNQQGVGRGLMSEDALSSIHTQMRAALAEQGVELAGVFACPHLADAGCFCRKPRPGLIQRALNETRFLVDLEASWLIGDSASDIEAGAAMGLRTIRVTDGPADAAATHTVARLADVLPLVARPGASAR
jgi:D-sedoheptulose 7-phosphate isomerase